MKSNADNAGTAPAASPFVNPGEINAEGDPLVEAPEFTFAGYLRFVLMLFVGFWAFGCPEPTGIVTVLSGFATPCFFILSGYFILVDDREHRLHKLKRKLIRGTSCLVFVFVLYAIINAVIFFLSHMTLAVGKRMIFNFVVLNLWPCPIGDNFWFIQAMLYAYIIIYIADKLNLFKLYKGVLVITFIAMLLLGEFAGVIHFNFLGYPYIPGNWLTRALPYILLGRLIREHKDFLLSWRKFVYWILFVVGGGLVILELFVLARTGYLIYEGHTIGYGVMAFALCCWALSVPFVTPNRIVHFDPAMSGFVYIFMNPVYCLLIMFLGAQYPYFAYYMGVIAAWLISVVIAFLLTPTRFSDLFYSNWEMRLDNYFAKGGEEFE
ncbi:MAG: acyltransferase [Clostridiales bacterium]|nr:acyltransferase [Clostridiales bacterium]